MPPAPTQDYLNGLVAELRKLPQETGWAEFKENNPNPEDIGEYLSALSNTAALHGKANGYVVWGVKDGSHEVIGTTFKPAQTKKGNEDIASWLLRLLSPRLHFKFYEVVHEGQPVVVLEIPRAEGRPVQFQGVEFIRVGSYRQKLKDHPQIEKDLWRVFDTTPFEELIALPHADPADVLSLLEYTAYFELLDQPLPTDRDKILARLADDRLIVPDSAGKWNITNLGALLFARNLEEFKHLGRKVVRIVVYEGKGRLKTLREQPIRKGYAVGFQDMLTQLNNLLPRSEVVDHGVRREVPLYPEPAIRELIPNALIHQDLTLTGSGPMIEIFKDRMEITNPGSPLIETGRFLDSPPRSRNEALASFMRRLGICEERGSGVDKVVAETELHQLPAPLFESPEGFTRAVLFSHKALREMDRTERSRACYLHASLRYVERDVMTNSSLRARFGIQEQNSAFASRIIREAMEDGMVKRADETQGRKHAKYLPFWA
ncbi:MAG: putative DNA binding domain-containing protein [Cephaloticoccus sp.]|nr:putative DNA binding domain-containing protein [Akkermansiaceae bacterium]MCF7760102.1 putative DNA binding domain-containing protein [Cephaloticoccus sp.]